MGLLIAATLGLLLAGCQGLALDGAYDPEHEPEHEPLHNTRRGLYPGVLYQYKYTGTVYTWISEDTRQFSGSALRADLELERTQSGSIRVKASNVEVAEAHEKGACDVQKNVEFSYHPMNEADAALLEQSFLIEVGEATVVYMKVPDEPLWVTNVRRGIANSLPLYVMTGLNPSSLTYRLTEDTMIGQCYNWYSQLKLASYFAALEDGKQEDQIEVDVQRYAPESSSYTTKTKGRGTKSQPKTKRPSKTRKTGTKTGTKTSGGGPQEPPARLIQPINDTLWILTRSLDDEGCKGNHFTLKINGNQESEERTQRSSQGTFLIRGEQGAAMRLERAELNGDTVVYTGDCDDKFMRTRSKQVLQLKAVRHSEVQPEEAHELERKALHFETEEGPRLFTVEEQLTGIYPNDQQIEATIARIREDMLLLAEDEPERREAVMETFLHVVERISVLAKPEIERLASQVPDTLRAKKILYQVLLTSGTNEALTYLIEKMRSVTFRDENRFLVFQLFQASTITIKDPSLIPDMLDILSRMEEDDRPYEEVMRTTSLFSIAKLAHQYCLDPQTAGSCDPRCNTDSIFNTFLPKLASGLRDPHKWKQVVHLQAMCALRTPFIIPYLEPIIQGKSTDDIDLRINAIACLTADRHPKTAHSMALDILVPLMNNLAEVPEVRSIAFLVIATWEPTNLSWWEHVALLTWRETSPQVASFISTALTSLSTGSSPRSMSAKKVVHLAKHPSKLEAHSLARSTYLYLEEATKNCRGGTNVAVAWLSSTESFFPRAAFYLLKGTLVMGMPQKELAVYFGNMLSIWYKERYQSTFNLKESEDAETFFGIFEELQEHLELSGTSFSQREMFTMASLFSPMLIEFGAFSEAGFEEVGMQLAWTSGDFAQYFIPATLRLVDSALAFPSDLGLPVVVKHDEDIAYSIGFSQTPRGHEITVQMNHHQSVNMKTLVPWAEGQAVGAGLEGRTHITLPTHVPHISPRDSVIWILPELKVNLLTMSATMYTSLTPLFPFTSAALDPDETGGRKVVWRGEVLESSKKNQVAEQLGVSLTCEWRGDFKPPRNPLAAFEEMNPMQLHYNNFEYKVVFDPTASNTKHITFVGHIYTKKSESSTQDTDYQFSQVSQGAADYEFMSQVSGSSDSEIFSQTSNGGGDFVDQETQSQTVTTHMQRIEQEAITFAGGVMHTLSLSIEPNAGPRKFEFALTSSLASNERIGVKTPTKFHFTFVNSSVTEIFANIHWTCVDVRFETPYLPPLLPKEVLFETDLAQSLSINLYDAEYCGGSPKLQVEVHQDMSATAVEYIQGEADRGTCDGSFPQRLQPLYDNVHLEVTGDQELLSTAVAYQTWVTYSLGLNVVDIFRDGLRQAEDKISADAVLNLKTKEWKLSITDPHETFVYSLPGNNPTQEGGISFIQDYMFDSVSDDLDTVCYLTQHSVRTFDGLVHEFEPSSCWTAAAIHIPVSDELSQKSLQFAVQARYIDDQWEARLMWPVSALILDITKSEILLNEEPFSGQSDKFKVHRLRDSQLVEAGRVLVWVGDTVQIRVSDIYHGDVAGLCGNYDGEPSNDRKGPLGCLYTDSALLTTAWSSPALGCSRLALRAKRAKLGDFRDSCDKDVFQPTGITQHNVMENCTAWAYHHRTSPEEVQCHSRVPIPVCRSGCQASINFTTNLHYDCSPTSSTSGQQQQQYDSSGQCFSKVLPATIPAGCFHPE